MERLPVAGRETPINRATVPSAALAIIDEEGVEGPSMRRLGEALDRNPITPYRYAANKAAVVGSSAETDHFPAVAVGRFCL